MSYWIEIGFVIVVVLVLLHINEVRSEAQAAKKALASNIIDAGKWLEGGVSKQHNNKQQQLVDEDMQSNCLKAFRVCMMR